MIRRFAGVLACAVAIGSVAAADGPRRAIWAPPGWSESPSAVRRAIATAEASRADTVLVPVAPQAPSDGAVTALIDAARARGLRVFLSVDASLVATAGELPAARDHVIYQHPEWLMVPRELSRELQRLEPQSPDYLGRLARWSRVNTDRVDGLYVSPLTRAAALFVAGRIRSVVERFPVDGVHVSSLLYPAGDFDYSRAALEAFRTEVVHDIPAAERRAADDVYGLNPFAYVEHYPEAWRRFRQTQLTALATLVRSEIRKVRPGAPVVATVAGDAAAALRGHLQDWSTWLDNGFLDAVLQPDGVGDAWGFTAASGPGVGSSMPVGPAPPVVLAR